MHVAAHVRLVFVFPTSSVHDCVIVCFVQRVEVEGAESQTQAPRAAGVNGLYSHLTPADTGNMSSQL